MENNNEILNINLEELQEAGMEREILNETDPDDEIVEEEVVFNESDDEYDDDDEIVEEEVNFDQKDDAGRIMLPVVESALEEGFQEINEFDRILEAVEDRSNQTHEQLLEYQTSIIRVGKKEKIERLKSRTCFLIAKEKNDPLYIKLKKINATRKILKAQIEKKYMAQANARVRKYLSGRGVEENDIPKKDPNAKAQ